MSQVDAKSVITLRSPLEEGGYCAVFAPDKGMNLISFQKDGVEVIDQATGSLFEERLAGLGALIGPHFHRRRDEILPPLPPSLPWPHVYRTSHDPFSHGIGRYASWHVEKRQSSLCGILKGSDLAADVPLKALEGQDFTLKFSASLSKEGLSIEYCVVSQTDSLVGLHYYYRLPKGKGRLLFQAKKEMFQRGESVPIPPHWLTSAKSFSLDLEEQELDYTFHPFPNPCESKVVLETQEYTLSMHSRFPSQENSFQLYRPKGASFVCIEPISSQFPEKPNLTVSKLQSLLTINT